MASADHDFMLQVVPTAATKIVEHALPELEVDVKANKMMAQSMTGAEMIVWLRNGASSGAASVVR